MERWDREEQGDREGGTGQSVWSTVTTFSATRMAGVEGHEVVEFSPVLGVYSTAMRRQLRQYFERVKGNSHS